MVTEKANSISISVDEATAERMESFYQNKMEVDPSSPISMRAKEEKTSITLYKRNKKGERKALFQGEDALNEARIWDENATSLLSKTAKNIIINRYPQIGSDEVGTGDFFGPIIVTAAFIEKEDLPLLEELGITDSKKMSDQRILELGPELIKRFDYSELSLSNDVYNEKVSKKFNMNAIKAKMHNAALLNLKKRHPEAYVYIDQFAEESLYYSYLKGEKEILQGINFMTKGESHFPAVALASVIARYAFLRKMAKLSETYGVSFPLGAGLEVDEFASSFLSKFGEKELSKVAKLNFANYKKLTPNSK